MMFTIFGGGGFVGSHLAAHLSAQGRTVWVPGRDETLPTDRDLGHLFYCIGRTADFRTRLLDTIDAHVSHLVGILRAGNFQSLTYLSSTRIYGGAQDTRLDSRFSVDPSDPSDVYNLSKLVGEAACLTAGRPSIRVARLANVYGVKIGTGDFLLSLIHDALTIGHVHLRQAGGSEKDYVDVADVARALVAIALNGRERIYNVAAGENVSHTAILEALMRETGCTVSIEVGAPHVAFPPIDIRTLREELGINPARLTDRLGPLVRAYKERL